MDNEMRRLIELYEKQTKGLQDEMRNLNDQSLIRKIHRNEKLE